MMRKALAAIGSIVFLLLAPGFVAGLVPYWITRWHFEPPILGLAVLRLVGAVMIAAGLPVLLESFWRFAVKGLGTPAPIMPTRSLVVSGWYRYVRNPMYVAVLSLVAGQGLLFGSARVLEYAVLVWIAFYLFVLFYEEPTLAASFPKEYAEFRRNVPRWIPRVKPWNGT